MLEKKYLQLLVRMVENALHLMFCIFRRYALLYEFNTSVNCRIKSGPYNPFQYILNGQTVRFLAVEAGMTHAFGYIIRQ